MMRKYTFTPAAIFAVLLLASAAVRAEEFQIDPSHSAAVFTVRHMVISNVTGRFTNVSGTIVYDDKDVTKSSVNAVIKVASVNTDNEGRDKHLKSPDFFDAEKYPDITFKSKRVEKRGDQLVAIGTLTMKDVSKEIELPFELNTLKTPHGMRVGIASSTKINRQDYHISFSQKLDNGGLAVSDDVKIDLNLEGQAVPAKADAAPSKK